VTSPARPRAAALVRLPVELPACPTVGELVEAVPARPGMTAARGSMTS